MMAAECGHSLSRPAIPAAGKMTIPVQNTSDNVITADASQDQNAFYQFARCLCAALAATSARQAQFGMCAALPVKGEDQLACRSIHVHQNFLDQCADNALFQSHTGGWIGPDGLQLLGELAEVLNRRCWTWIDCSALLLDAHFDLPYMLQGEVPAAFQLRRNEAVLRICRIKLALRPLRRITGCFQIAVQSIQNVVSLAAQLFFG